VKSILEKKSKIMPFRLLLHNFGDPIPFVQKELYIKWKYKNAQGIITVSEHKAIKITKGNNPELF
jgi:hypothetical protein